MKSTLKLFRVLMFLILGGSASSTKGGICIVNITCNRSLQLWEMHYKGYCIKSFLWRKNAQCLCMLKCRITHPTIILSNISFHILDKGNTKLSSIHLDIIMITMPWWCMIAYPTHSIWGEAFCFEILSGVKSWYRIKN